MAELEYESFLPRVLRKNSPNASFGLPVEQKGAGREKKSKPPLLWLR
jgi:hypothetical protein